MSHCLVAGNSVFTPVPFFSIARIYIISTCDSAMKPVAPSEIRIMRNRIGVYWPVALIVPLAVVAWIHAWNTAVEQMPLAADKLTAELARVVSYGLAGGDGDTPARLKAMPAGEGVPASQAI